MIHTFILEKLGMSIQPRAMNLLHLLWLATVFYILDPIIDCLLVIQITEYKKISPEFFLNWQQRGLISRYPCCNTKFQWGLSCNECSSVQLNIPFENGVGAYFNLNQTRVWNFIITNWSLLFRAYLVAVIPNLNPIL